MSEANSMKRAEARRGIPRVRRQPLTGLAMYIAGMVHQNVLFLTKRGDLQPYDLYEAERVLLALAGALSEKRAFMRRDRRRADNREDGS